ncbi:MAG TPA: sugar phosphate nucleotidyltransferase [Nitrospiraceae bacterium]|nr:sugar phosphate nucleotidyltransferase [Nitrospiraceae bacterium]
MNNQAITGVILAAGKSTRMQPFSARFPKPILPICNRPVIEYQIEEMKRLGIEDIIIVVGHLGFEVSLALGNGSRLGVNIRYVDQRDTMGIAHAVGQLEPYIDHRFLLFLGDIFFKTKDLQDMLTLMDEGAHAVLAVRREESLEAIGRNFSVVIDDDHRVRRVIEKPRHPPNKIKGCGLYLFDPHIFDAIRRTPQTAGRNEYELTSSIQLLIEDDFAVRIAEVVTYDINLTFPQDLLTCNLKQLKFLGQESLVGKSCRLHPDVKVINSVIGDGVTVAQPIEIRDSLILSDSVVTYRGDLNRIIFTPDSIIDCRLMER